MPVLIRLIEKKLRYFSFYCRRLEVFCEKGAVAQIILIISMCYGVCSGGALIRYRCEPLYQDPAEIEDDSL
jgi:hypothetical protein